MSYQPILKDFAEAGIRRSFCKFHGLFLRVCVQSASGTLFDTSKVVHRPLYFPFTWYDMLPIATTSELVSSSRSIFCRGAARASASATPKVQVRIRTLHQDSRPSTGPSAFAYLSKKRRQPVVTVAINMSTLSRRNLSSTSSSASSNSKQPSKSDSHSHSHADKHSHTHAHDDGHDHDHDHSHGGIFHSHAHDHSEGAEQIMKALTKGQLDRGTRITLLGQFPYAYRLGYQC
jgi:hypothetical protein